MRLVLLLSNQFRYIKQYSYHGVKFIFQIVYTIIQINCLSIDFWESGLDDGDLELMHQNRMYPPRIEMTVQLKQLPGLTLSVSFEGCTPGEGALEELQFAFPLGNDL